MAASDSTQKRRHKPRLGRIIVKCCHFCGAEFEQRTARGTPRKYCGETCRRASEDSARAHYGRDRGPCATPLCDRRVRRRSPLCEGCYMRFRRKGTVDYTRAYSVLRYTDPRGYVRVRRPGGDVYEHALVFWMHSADRRQCADCDGWITRETARIIHRNGCIGDNELANLEGLCHPCLSRRIGLTLGKYFEIDGARVTATQMAKATGIGYAALRARIRNGLPPDVGIAMGLLIELRRALKETQS